MKRTNLPSTRKAISRLFLIILTVCALSASNDASAQGIAREADSTPPTLNDILNSTQLDLRSSETLPDPKTAKVIEIRSDAPVRQRFRTGADVVRIVNVAIWFTGWSASWTPEKSLAMTLRDEETGVELAKSVEPYSQRLWENGVHIFTFNAPAVSGHNYSFELSVEGGDTLRGAAIASGTILDGVGLLAQNGRRVGGAIWFEIGVKRRGDLDEIYSQIFSRYDLARPDMAAVRQTVANRDWEQAKRTLIAHFENRKDLFPSSVNPVANIRQMASLPDDVKQNRFLEADLAVDHKFVAVDEIVDLGPRWNHLAAWRTRGGVGLTRAGLRGVLANAYAATHDEKYAQAWDAMLRYQFEDLPSPLRAGLILPEARNIPPVGEAGLGGGSMWSSLSTGARMMHGFAYYKAFLHSSNFGLDTRFAFIVNLAEMSDVLEKMKGGGNWEAQNTSALFNISLMFPEFKKSSGWLASGFSGAMQSCLDNTFPDGPLREASTNYHNLSLNRYLAVLETVKYRKLTGLAISQQIYERVEKMCDYLLYSTMPNGLLPIWGDSNPPEDALSLLKRGADYFNRPDMLWVATRGKYGSPPASTSIEFPDAGYFLMRSNWSADPAAKLKVKTKSSHHAISKPRAIWDPNAVFLSLHNGRSSAHGHADANSFVLTANGNELLIDPGIYIYGTSESRLLASTISHNTVTMDDRNTVNDVGEANWQTGNLMDVYEGANAGYEGSRKGESAAKHLRKIVFFKPGLFLMLDEAKDEKLHDWAMRLHFARGDAEPAENGSYIRFICERHESFAPYPDTGLRVWSGTSEGSHLAISKGLAAAGWEIKQETPVASWVQLQTDKAIWATLLEPFTGSSAAPEWHVLNSQSGAALAYHTGLSGTKLIITRFNTQPAYPAEWDAIAKTNADAACFEEIPAAKGRSASRRLAVMEVSVFTLNRTETPVLRAETPVKLFEAEWSGDLLRVHRFGGAGITLRTFGARHLIINGGKRIDLSAGVETIKLPD